MAMEMQDLLDSLDGRDLIYGISTAAKHIGGIAPCLSGSGSCPKDVFGLADAALWTKELEESVNRLVYAIEKMHQNDVIEKSIRDGSGIQSGAVLEYDCVLSARAKDLDGDVLWQKGGMEIDPKMPLLWQHIRLQPIGKHLKVLDQDEDVTKASFAIADIPLGRDAAVLLKFGALRKSHGFIPREFRPNSVKKVDGKTIVTGWDVLKSYCVEGSLVSVPANPRADILKVYAKEFDGVCTAHSRGMLKSPAVVAWSKSVFDSRPSMELGADLDEKNCGTGDGGFKPGNHCAGGGGSGGSGAAGGGGGGGAADGNGGDSKTGSKPAKDGKKKKADDGGSGPAGMPAGTVSPATKRTGLYVGAYNTFEEFTEKGLNTPGGRQWPQQVATANGFLIKNKEKPQDYELRLVAVKDLKPTQTGEDYLNDSSRATARSLQKLNGMSRGQMAIDDQNIDDLPVRFSDLNPVAVRRDGTIIDGNHRHAAATLNKETHMLALVAVGEGTGKITNLRESYESLKKDKAPGPAVGSNTKKKSLGEGDDESDGDEMAKAAEGGCSCRAHAAEAVAGVDQSVASVAEKVDEAIKSIAGLQELISESTLGIVAGAKSLDEKKLPSPKAGEADDDFVGRCMHEAQGDFPDNKQRVAVCLGRRRKPKQLGGLACKDLVESVTINSRASVPNDVNTSYLRGSWEWIQDVLRNDAKSYLRSSGVSMNYDSWVELLATFAQSCVLSLRDYTRDEVTGESKRRVRCFEVAWSTGSDGIPTLTGEPKAVTVGLEVKPKSFEAVLALAQLGDAEALGLLSKAAGVSDLLRQHEHLEGFF